MILGRCPLSYECAAAFTPSFFWHSWSLAWEETRLQAELSGLRCSRLSSYTNYALPSPPLNWSPLEYAPKKIILLCLALALVSSSTLHLGSVTKCYSIFLRGDWGTTWLRVLCEAMQKACAINCRMAAGVSSRVVLCVLLLLRCLSSWDPQRCNIPSLWGCMFKNLYSGRRKN